MGKSDTQRLREINSQLIKLYLRLHQLPVDDSEESRVRFEIMKFETKKDRLPKPLLYDDKIQQYVIILRSAASSLQLQRQTKNQFSDNAKSQLSPDEIRQKNIRLNKLNGIEKKIESYRQKLSDMGLRPFELDDIVLEGYREQNQRLSQKLLRSLELTILDYLEEIYQDKGNLPEDLLGSIQSWENDETRAELTYNQLRVLDAKTQCIQMGIQYVDIVMSIESVARWDNEKKQHQLHVLKSKLLQEIDILDGAVNVMVEVNEWAKQHEAGKRLKPNQVSIVTLINQMQMYGISQDKIEAMLNSLLPKSNGLFSSFKNRLRRKS